MARPIAAALAAASLAACSSDICGAQYALEQKIISAVSGCPVDGGSTFAINDTPQSTWIPACEAAIKSCTSADQVAIAKAQSCENGLPAYQCAWLSEGLDLLDDPAFVQYQAAAEACTGAVDDGGVSPACATMFKDLPPALSFAPQSGGESWSGAYTVASGAFFTDGADTTPPSDPETLTPSGATLTWTDFASPAIPGCTLTLPFGDAGPTFVSPFCGGWTANDSELGTIGPEIIVSLSGNDPDGGAYSLSFSLTPG